MPAYRSVSKKKLQKIIARLQKETVAQRASQHDFDNQDCHIAYIKRQDPRIQSARSSTSSFSLGSVNRRVQQPTAASRAARYDFDAQSCHIEYLKQTVENYPPPKKIVTTRQLDDITRKLMSASTAASTAARHDFDAQRAHVAYLELQDPKYPGHKRYGFRVHSAPFRDATPAELDDMVGRWCKPTVASQGGAPLLSKNYDYYVPKPSPTCPEVRGLDQMFRGNKKMTQEQLSASIARLNTPHKRFQNPTKCR